MKKNLKHFNIVAAKKAYNEGKNITKLLREQIDSNSNTPEIIETAYDLQAGSYIKEIIQNPEQSNLYTREIAEILDKHITSGDSLLDVGTGELTTIVNVINKLNNKPKKIMAFDISWSRVYEGLQYAQKIQNFQNNKIEAFVADINEIPLQDKSVNIITTSHALEPNGENLKELLMELFRVAITKLVLFEPSYEINTKEGQRRMNELGYIKNIQSTAEELGAKLLDKIIIKNINNPLNPTVCYIISPPFCGTLSSKVKEGKSECYTVPGTSIGLIKIDNFYFSEKTGQCYPVLKGIPILKSSVAILASALKSKIYK